MLMSVMNAFSCLSNNGPLSRPSSLSQCDKQLIVCATNNNSELASATCATVDLIESRPLLERTPLVESLWGLCHYCPISHHTTDSPAGVSLTFFSLQ